MMNKGLEVIEACKLFELDITKVDAIIHPESLVHGMVHYDDGSILAQMACADMRTPISTAFEYPKRTKFSHHPLDLTKVGSLTFREIDKKRFPLFYLAKEVYKTGNCALIAFNVANEVAVEAYLNKRLGFLDINKVIENALQRIKDVDITSVEDVIQYANMCAHQSEKFPKS